MEVFLLGAAGALIVACLIGAVWAFRRGNRLDEELKETRLDDRFDSLNRYFDERLETLKRENETTHEELQREFQSNLENHDRYNTTEFDGIRLRLDKLEE